MSDTFCYIHDSFGCIYDLGFGCSFYLFLRGGGFRVGLPHLLIILLCWVLYPCFDSAGLRLGFLASAGGLMFLQWGGRRLEHTPFGHLPMIPHMGHGFIVFTLH